LEKHSLGADPASAPAELSGREIESAIDRGTDAANAITLKDYSTLTAGPTV